MSLVDLLVGDFVGLDAVVGRRRDDRLLHGVAGKEPSVLIAHRQLFRLPFFAFAEALSPPAFRFLCRR